MRGLRSGIVSRTALNRRNRASRILASCSGDNALLIAVLDSVLSL